MTFIPVRRRIFVLGFLTFLVPALRASATSRTELVMLEQPGCPWCVRFNAQIASAWPKTAEGKRAPLRRVDITQPWPDDLKDIARERFTPTFILVDDGREIGRLRGYPGDEFFWFSIGELIAKLPKE